MWNPASGNVGIPQLIISGDSQLYRGLRHLDDAQQWLFTLTATPIDGIDDGFRVFEKAVKPRLGTWLMV
jgi:hypothetical protein